MKDTTRARVAAAVGAAVQNKNVGAVYDFSASSYRYISASVTNGVLNGFDYSTSTHFSGGGNGALNFYDYHNSKHVQLKISNGKFDGYDYDTQKHFSGIFTGSSITLYDYETSTYYNYTV